MIVHLMCKESLVTMALHVVHLHHGMNAVHGQMLTLCTENFFGKENFCRPTDPVFLRLCYRKHNSFSSRPNAFATLKSRPIGLLSV